MKASKKAARRRAQGRPNEGQSSVGPETLLRAARELLETLPPAKVTRAAVARHAGVDPNLIRYYFQDRDSLLLAVAERVVEERAQQLSGALEGTAADRLREHVRIFLEFNAAQPFFQRLLLDEIATWKSARARQLFQRSNQLAIDVYAAIIRDGVKDKSLRSVDPALLHVAVVGMTEFVSSSRVVLEDAFGKGATPAELAQRYADVVTTLVVDGLRARH